MNNKLNALINLRSALLDMEQDLGLLEMSDLEKQVFLAIADLDQKNCCAATKDLLTHPFVQNFSRPSLFRSLKALEKSKKIKKVGLTRGYYSVALDG